MIDRTETIEGLEKLAAWHRINAEHAGSAWVWEARLLAAEDLERRAAALRAREMRDSHPVRHAAGRRRSRGSQSVQAIIDAAKIG